MMRFTTLPPPPKRLMHKMHEALRRPTHIPHATLYNDGGLERYYAR